MLKKTIYYWSPFLTNIATSKAVINSAYAINRYNNNFEAIILNAAGEFDLKKKELIKKNVSLISLWSFNYIRFLPKFGKISSRLSFSIIFILSFLPLKKVIKNNKPEFLIIHLITLLPLILYNLFSFKTKCILRISGYPRMSIIRIILWRFLLKKVYAVTCPTKSTYNYLKYLNICDENKLQVLYDPVIIVSELNFKKRESNNINFENFAISIGRLTEQKNFEFLINSYNKDKDLKLIIVGEGENFKKLQDKIKFYDLSSHIFIESYKDNIFSYLKKSKCLLISSLWEDPGFVLIEAAFCRTFIISSNFKICSNEIILDKNAGLVYQANNKNDFVNKYDLFKNMNENDRNKYRKNALIMSKDFTIFRHAKQLDKILI